MKALFIANYVIEYSNDQGFEISNLKLQKLLYFINARNLVDNGKPIFEEKMEKWRYGPVVPEVYRQYKEFGAANIDKENISQEILEFKGNPFDDDFGIEVKKYVDYKNDIIENHEDLIQSTIYALRNKDAFELVKITHEHSIWKDYEDEILYDVDNLKYDNEEIKNFFNGDLKNQIWLN